MTERFRIVLAICAIVAITSAFPFLYYSRKAEQQFELDQRRIELGDPVRLLCREVGAK